MAPRFKRLFGPLLAFVLIFSAAVAAAPSRANPSNPSGKWVIVFNQPHSLPSNVDSIVGNAGGTITVRLPEIGAIGVTSTNPDFAATIAGNPHVQAVSPDIEVQMIPDVHGLGSSAGGGPVEPPGADPQPMPDNLGNQQWDKMRMNATAIGSYAVQRGRRDVVVAVLDTGAEVLPTPHVDIAPNLDFARSRSFVGGVVDPNPAAWDDKNGHGSWCLSAVGAPINVVGISGVAPNVTLVALKVLGDNGSGSFLWLAQALVYAGVNKFDVASMSLGGYLRHADGFQALTKVVQRAIDFARSNGVTPIAALGNDNFDLSDGAFFRDFIEVPGELPGVIGVSSTGYYNLKAYYSNYGSGKADVAAPGGDRRYQDPPPTYRGEGRVLGAYATEAIGTIAAPLREEECDPGPGGSCSYYAWIQGTSMATPNAAGVAALIISQYGDFTPDNSQKLHMSPQAVESVLQITANNQPCPDPNLVVYPLNTRPPGTFEGTALCRGEAGGYTSFYGKGIVDALKAVTEYQNH
ncbi:MAG TPA: S8 family serine peptidase [Herpetosiphonaceae bacterium]